MSGIVLSSSVRQNLLSLQSTADLLSTTQNRLATGNKVNSALDNPTSFFTAQSLNNRASDIGNLLAVRDTGECPCEPAEPLLRARITEIDAEMDRLGRLRGDLVAMAEQLPSATCPDPVPGTWCPPDHPKTEGRCDACSI